ncbi:hypothetical protein B566_EDAN008042 [Ephemera danica]|nr:hypothetical protein B566_EDAN008042 [Ephemera danica]
MRSWLSSLFKEEFSKRGVMDESDDKVGVARVYLARRTVYLDDDHPNADQFSLAFKFEDRPKEWAVITGVLGNGPKLIPYYRSSNIKPSDDIIDPFDFQAWIPKVNELDYLMRNLTLPKRVKISPCGIRQLAMENWINGNNFCHGNVDSFHWIIYAAQELIHA